MKALQRWLESTNTASDKDKLVNLEAKRHRMVPPPLLKNFRTSGKIGEPGSKDKLTSSSLACKFSTIWRGEAT